MPYSFDLHNVIRQICFHKRKLTFMYKGTTGGDSRTIVPWPLLGTLRENEPQAARLQEGQIRNG